MSNHRPVPVAEKKRRLIESIRLLASDADTQLASLPEFVHKPDELGLIFDETRRFLDELTGAGLLTIEHAQFIKDIDAKLSAMSGKSNSALWTIEALRSNAEWESVRKMAGKSLESLSCTLSKPNIDWMTYVKGS